MRWIVFLLVPAVLLLAAACEEELAGSDDEPSLNPTVETILEEIFWIAVDAAGIDRTIGFEDAKFLLSESLFASYDRRLTEIEEFGIEPFDEWPYCINAESGVAAMVSLNQSDSPLEAAPHANKAIEVIESLESDVTSARDFGVSSLSQSESKQRCDAFVDELRELYGFDPLER